LAKILKHLRYGFFMEQFEPGCLYTKFSLIVNWEMMLPTIGVGVFLLSIWLFRISWGT